jgi:hypothetical protein
MTDKPMVQGPTFPQPPAIITRPTLTPRFTPKRQTVTLFT